MSRDFCVIGFIRSAVVVSAVVLCFVAGVSHAAHAAANVYLGIQHTVSTDPPGMKLDVVLDAPAYKSGLRTGDVVLAFDGVPLGADGATYAAALETALAGKVPGDTIVVHVWRPGPFYSVTVNGEEVAVEAPLAELAELIANLPPDGELKLTAVNTSKELDITVTLGPRPEGGAGMIPSNYELLPGRLYDEGLSDVHELIDKLLDETGTKAQFDDLMGRLNARATPNDGYRFQMVTYLLRNGLQGEVVTRSIALNIEGSATDPDLKQAGVRGSSFIWGGWYGYTGNSDQPIWDSYRQPYRELTTAEEYIEYYEAELAYAAKLVQFAFDNLTSDEIAFIRDNRVGITDVYKAENYIDADTNIKRFRNNIRLIELSKKIYYTPLIQAERRLLDLTQPDLLDSLKTALIAKFGDDPNGQVLYEKETPLGWIVVQGKGRTWRSLSTDPAQYRHDLLVIDLGGDDFYSTTAGSGISPEYPIGMLIDFGGNDAYESTLHYSQGSGSMGCGLLVDMEGDDSYIGTQWAQGTGFLGCGALVDASGNDTYRGHEFCQSAAIFGMSLLYDCAGNDMYEGHCKVQGFGGARSVALLVDLEGDDSRYAKGTYATGYGDPGIFDAWSQGCGDGFRQYASGGIGGVIDFAGNDRCEAGNFSTGGGYYFGWGFYYDGKGDDRYIGSRYNQGFCAHQAVGVFLDMEGNDVYQTRQGVAQGLAWDECVTVFIDYAGDDIYQGGTGFSQGASAHNALCLFRDKSGNDTYDYPAGQARAGGNDYHGGTSLSLFLDEGGGTDKYNWDVASVFVQPAAAASGVAENAEGAAGAEHETTVTTAEVRTDANNLITGWKEYGFFADLPGTLDDALAGDKWRDLWVWHNPQ